MSMFRTLVCFQNSTTRHPALSIMLTTIKFIYMS